MKNESATKSFPSALYVWLVRSEEVLDQPGSWRIRKWDTEPFPEANFTVSETRATEHWTDVEWVSGLEQAAALCDQEAAACVGYDNALGTPEMWALEANAMRHCAKKIRDFIAARPYIPEATPSAIATKNAAPHQEPNKQQVGDGTIAEPDEVAAPHDKHGIAKDAFGREYVTNIHDAATRIRQLEATASATPMPDVRDLAVEIVDGLAGYTCEFAPSPMLHREKYDFWEERIKEFLKQPRYVHSSPSVGNCPKCGVNRFKAACPYKYSSPINCPMVGTAEGQKEPT